MRTAPRRLDVPAPHGHLEALLQEPEAPSFAALVCHPHPLHGGTMDNNVVYRLARALYDAGAVTLRFNFRGVGRSTGTYADGVGEQDDVLAGLDFLASRHPGLRLWIAGFSFGSRVGLSVGARDPRVEALLGVGLALSKFDFGFLETCARPKAFVQGDEDEFGTGAQVESLVAAMPDPKRLWRIPGARHLFPGQLPELEKAVSEAVAWLTSVVSPTRPTP